MKLYALSQLVILSLMWGPAFLFMTVAGKEVPPLTVAAVRVSLGAVLLFLVLRGQGRTLPKFGPVWKHFGVMGLTDNAIPFFLLTWGQLYIDSALSAILVGTMPLFTMLLAHLSTADDRLSAGKIVGMILGFGGLVTLFLPALVEGVQATLWGLAAAVGAAINYSISFVYARKKLRGLPPLVGPTAQLVAASLLLLPLALLLDRPYSLPIPSWPALGSLLMMGVWSTGLAFAVYYRAMEHISATTLSLISYLNPVVATILGMVVLHERLGWNTYLGYLLITMGAVFVNELVTLDRHHFSRSWWRTIMES